MKRLAARITAVALSVILVIAAVIVFPPGGNEEDGLPIVPLPLGVQQVQAAERVFNLLNAEAALGASVSPDMIDTALEGQTERGGLILAPTIVGSAGVDAFSSFVLRRCATLPVALRSYVPDITIDGADAPHISREDTITWIITPAVPLTYNSVYVFRYRQISGEADITWAFQTARRFEITGTLPRDQGTNVPIRTGIEINFSFGEDVDISQHFSIYPRVTGEFIHRGSTSIFVPDRPLAHATIYTVTIGAGISVDGSAPTSERVFRFETEPPPERRQRPHSRTTIHLNEGYLEFPSFAAPRIDFWLSVDRDRNRPPIDISVYRMDDLSRATAAVNNLTWAHGWSNFWFEDNYIESEGLERVYSSTIYQRADGSDRWNESYTFSQTLPTGFYLLNATVRDAENHQRQAIIQVTDLAVQIIGDDERMLVWVNDMHTGSPAAGATVYEPISGNAFTAADYGIAVVEREMEFGEYLFITAGDMESVVFINPRNQQGFWGWHRRVSPPMEVMSWDMDLDWGWSPRHSHTANARYWTALQLDRTLFQRNDIVNVWGFVQNRHVQEDISHVRVELTETNWWRWDAEGDDLLHVENLPVNYGAYSGEIQLPHLDPGSYQIAVYHGDILLNSMFFTVMDYVTPPYRLSVSASHAAIFAGDEVSFTARTAFFEGTPVPDLSLSYGMWGNSLRLPRGHGTGQTDIDGMFERSARPTADNNEVQGQRTMQFTVEATLPEIGWVHERSSVRVFINDINVRARASRDEGNANLTVDIHNITLDRLNDGTSEHWGDFLCTPRADHRVNAEIVELWWVREQIGEFYCHITRQTVPRYRHTQRERVLETLTLRTDNDGNINHDFTVPNAYRRSYQVRLTTTDGNGRTIRHTAFVGRDFTSFFNQAEDTRMFLYGAEEDGYDIGDPVQLTLMRGMYPVEQGNILFVIVQGGIMSYHIGSNELNMIFGEQHVPNAQVFAYHFNGHIFTAGGSMSQRLFFNPTHRELVINIETCQEYYRPGETPTFIVTATDIHGNPKQANINISLVDEALFALMDYTVDTLAMLYAQVPDRLRISAATHHTFASDGIDDLDYAVSPPAGQRQVATTAPAMAAGDMAVEEAADDGGGGADTRIRERFEDTAMFVSVRTDAQGRATFSRELPDNVTTWRVTASGISNTLYAGNRIQDIRVTLPMFLHYTLSSVFLIGDTPTIGVNAFGTALQGGEEALFEVWRESHPNDIRTARGRAFERVNIPLWEKSEEGTHAIVVRVSIDGRGDAIRHEYTVIASHRQIDTAEFISVTPQTVFNVNDTGLTNITFTDMGRGQFLHNLFSLRHTWWSGARLEALVAAREATSLINTHFPSVHLWGTSRGFDIADYQTEEGGLAVLPYSGAELEVTVKLLPFIMEEVNLPALTRYLRNTALTSQTDNRILALYGLALLGEPVLHDLQRYALLAEMPQGISIRNLTYVALGFAALGDTQTARDLFDTHIAPEIQAIAPYYRVTGENRRQTVETTSIVALLAAQLGDSRAMGLHNYASAHRIREAQPWNPARPYDRNDTMLFNIERLLFISYEIENHNASEASITYTLFGRTYTRNLGHGGQYNLRIPAANFHEFNITAVTGEVGAVNITRTPLADTTPIENDITVTRQFFRAGSNTPATTFAQDEVIRVQITVDYSARDLTGTYVITDFLPAGLVVVQHSARFGPRGQNPGRRAWVTTEGQRVTFHDHNSRFDREHTYFYYARVVTPGTFTAEGTIVQSLNARQYMAIGDCAVITIQ